MPFLFIAVLLKILMVLSLGTSHKSYSHLCYSWPFGALPTVLSAFKSVTRRSMTNFSHKLKESINTNTNVGS